MLNNDSQSETSNKSSYNSNEIININTNNASDLFYVKHILNLFNDVSNEILKKTIDKLVNKSYIKKVYKQNELIKIVVSNKKMVITLYYYYNAKFILLLCKSNMIYKELAQNTNNNLTVLLMQLIDLHEINKDSNEKEQKTKCCNFCDNENINELKLICNNCIYNNKIKE